MTKTTIQALSDKDLADRLQRIPTEMADRRCELIAEALARLLLRPSAPKNRV